MGYGKSTLRKGTCEQRGSLKLEAEFREKRAKQLPFLFSLPACPILTRGNRMNPENNTSSTQQEQSNAFESQISPIYVTGASLDRASLQSSS